MNWIDYTIMSIVFFSALLGLVNGLFSQFLGTICLLVSFYAALFFYDVLGNILKGIFNPSTTNLISYFIIFGVVFIVTYIITEIVKKVMIKWNARFGVRLVGALIGVFKGILFCGIIIFGVLSFSSKSTCDMVHTSKIATHIGRGMQTASIIIPAKVSDRVREYAEEVRGNKKTKDAKSAKDKQNKTTR
jgi:uncharacterized membrane protein required for colicin V production